MNYATGHALNVNEMFLGFPTRKMKLTASQCEELIGNRHKECIAKDIFRSAVNLVLDDIIENSNMFQLPTNKRRAEIRIKRISGDEFIKLRKMGKFRNIDFLESDFSGYQMVFNFLSAGVMREKPIYLDPKHRDTIADKVNHGKVYS